MVVIAFGVVESLREVGGENSIVFAKYKADMPHISAAAGSPATELKTEVAASKIAGPAKAKFASFDIAFSPLVKTHYMI